MPEPLVSTDIPPGDYAIAGTDKILVIEGRAYWRPPSSPAPLVTPSPAGPSWLKGVLTGLAAVALPAVGYFLGLQPSAPVVVPPAPAPVVVPVVPPAPAPTPTPAPNPGRPYNPPPGVEPDGSFPVRPSGQFPR